MPRTSINYSNTIIYKIQHNDKDELIYVGHTTDFTKRKSSHKLITRSEKDKAYNRQLYKMIRDNGGWESFKMIEIKTFSCTNKREAEAEEDKVMRELKATMNMNRAFLRTEDIIEDRRIYREIHADEIKEKAKIFRATHTEEIKEKAKIYRENLNKDENGNRTIDAYLEKLRKQKINRDAYKERQKIKESAKMTQ
jgi:hypothetical protein